MQVKSILVLTVDEAREALVQWYADFLANDRNNLADLLRDGKLVLFCQRCRNTEFIKTLSNFLWSQFGKIGQLYNVTQVVVEVIPGMEWQLVWDIDNVPPKHRHDCKEEHADPYRKVFGV